jgi:hypothetical protein
MDLLEQEMNPVVAVSVPVLEPRVVEREELAARRSLRAQVAKLERDLADAFVTAFSMGGLPTRAQETRSDPRILGLGELERVRDELAEGCGLLVWRSQSAQRSRRRTACASSGCCWSRASTGSRGSRARTSASQGAGSGRSGRGSA